MSDHDPGPPIFFFFKLGLIYVNGWDHDAQKSNSKQNVFSPRSKVLDGVAIYLI